MTVVNTVLKQVVHRAWTDIEPKLIAVATTGVSAAAVTEVADYLGVDIQPALAVLVATILTAVAGYLKSSVIKVKEPVTKKAAATPAGPAKHVARPTPPAPVVDPGVDQAPRPQFEVVLKDVPAPVAAQDWGEDLPAKYTFAQSEPEPVLPDDTAQTSIPATVLPARVTPTDSRPLLPLLK